MNKMTYKNVCFYGKWCRRQILKKQLKRQRFFVTYIAELIVETIILVECYQIFSDCHKACKGFLLY